MDARPVEYDVDSLPRDMVCPICDHGAHSRLYCPDALIEGDEVVRCPCHIPAPGA